MLWFQQQGKAVLTLNIATYQIKQLDCKKGVIYDLYVLIQQELIRKDKYMETSKLQPNKQNHTALCIMQKLAIILSM